MRRDLAFLAVLGGLSLVIGHLSFAADVASPLSSADAQKAFQLADANLRIELAAAEPEVVDPVTIRFDEDGRMWVVEMRDYPLGNPTGGEPLSRIRVLEDKDGDGKFETATTFADKLLFVTGLQPWKGGVFVTLSGSLVYMKDTDGDGRADVDETWFDGFAEQNSQLRANHPRLGLDNWIYVANGLRGGVVKNRRVPEQGLINISGMDFRFDPLTGKAEAISGNGQYGLCFDDWGNRFTCSNRNPVKHVVIEDRYLKANPAVTVPAVVSDVAAWGEQSRIFPISRAWTTSNLHAGQFTAACGVYIYRGDLLPAEFKGNVFTCDPTGNLIHREIMQPSGPTFTSKAAYEGKEFLCSPDEWFRPVNMELGPDGALYVVDMYRCVIEHPDFVPDELKKRPDQRLGDDRGRIWRIVPSSNTNPTRQRGTDRPKLSQTASEDLVPLLEHPNAWQRETAQRLLIERERRPIIESVAKLAEQSASPQGRVQALAVLLSLGEIDPQRIMSALDDRDAHVRNAGVLFLERLTSPPSVAKWWGSARTRAVRASLVPRLADADPSVRFRARLAVADIASRTSIEHGELSQLASSVVRDANDQWQRCAVCLWIGQRAGVLTAELISKGSAGTASDDGIALLVRELCEQREYLCPVSSMERDPRLAIAALQGSMRGLARRKSDLANVASPGEINLLRRDLAAIAVDEKRDIAIRRDSAELIGYLPDSAGVIVPLLSREQPQSIRITAIVALARQPGNEHWNELLSRLAAETPPVRKAIVDGLLANASRTRLLLDAIEAGRIKANELDLQQAKRLTDNRDKEIKERAAKLFASATPADRAKALADYQPVLKMTGDAKKGQVIFEKNCAVCHRIAGIGVNVAPDISDSRTKKLEQLLGDILQPNRAIDNNYLGYNVRLQDGTVLAGILTAETATSITLRQQGGKDAVLSRSEIDELRSTGQSLMPEGLERQIPPPDMADLLSFIKNWRYLDGRTPVTSGQ